MIATRSIFFIVHCLSPDLERPDPPSSGLGFSLPRRYPLGPVRRKYFVSPQFLSPSYRSAYVLPPHRQTAPARIPHGFSAVWSIVDSQALPPELPSVGAPDPQPPCHPERRSPRRPESKDLQLLLQLSFCSAESQNPSLFETNGLHGDSDHFAAQNPAFDPAERCKGRAQPRRGAKVISPARQRWGGEPKIDP
jgi:hypothetical protein